MIHLEQRKGIIQARNNYINMFYSLLKTFLILAILIWIGMSSSSFGQVKTTFNFDKGQKEQLQRIKTLKKFNKQTIKSLQHQKKFLSKNIDSLSKQLDKDPHLAGYMQKYYGIKNLSKVNLESIDTLRNFNADSLSINGLAGDELMKYDVTSKVYLDKVADYQRQIKRTAYLQDSALLISKQLTMKELDKVEQQLQKQFMGKGTQKALGSDVLSGQDLLSGTEIPKELTSDLQGGDLSDMSEDQIKKAGIDYFKKHASKLDKVKNRMTNLKKKYSYVPNASDLKTAKKVNSLEGKPLKKRLVIGGNLQIHPGRTVGIDFNPLLGYKMNKKVSVGLGGTYRGILGRNEQVIPKDQDKVYGGRAFMDYKVLKSFYSHIEYELLNNTVSGKGSGADTAIKRWSHGLLFGAGRTYRYGPKVNGSVILMYNFLHNTKSPHESPWVVRFGFTLK